MHCSSQSCALPYVPLEPMWRRHATQWLYRTSTITFRAILYTNINACVGPTPLRIDLSTSDDCTPAWLPCAHIVTARTLQSRVSMPCEHRSRETEAKRRAITTRAYAPLPFHKPLPDCHSTMGLRIIVKFPTLQLMFLKVSV